MVNEIKDFKVWQPPKQQGEAAEEWLLESEYSFFGHSRQLTRTGWLWLILPWYFVIRKKLSFTLLEFSVAIMACGANSGAWISAVATLNKSPLVIGSVQYAIIHLHCLFFAEALYRSRIWQRSATGKWRGRVFFRQLPPLVVGLVLYIFWNNHLFKGQN